MEQSWNKSNLEVSKAIMLIKAYSHHHSFSAIEPQLKDEAVQETVTRMLGVEKFFNQIRFVNEMKAYAISVFNHVVTDLMKKEGKFRYATKSDGTQNKTIQNFTQEYNTVENYDDEEPIFMFSPEGGSIQSDDDPAKNVEFSNIGELVACVVNQLLATKDKAQGAFLYHVIWNDKLGVTLKQLAVVVGFESSNLPQVIKRFELEVIKELRSRGHGSLFD